LLFSQRSYFYDRDIRAVIVPDRQAVKKQMFIYRAWTDAFTKSIALLPIDPAVVTGVTVEGAAALMGRTARWRVSGGKRAGKGRT
jgi:hypothetical protein